MGLNDRPIPSQKVRLPTGPRRNAGVVPTAGSKHNLTRRWQRPRPPWCNRQRNRFH